MKEKEIGGVVVLDLQRQLWKLRGHFQKLTFVFQKQFTLDKFWWTLVNIYTI
jgi:hypothetical protein